MANMSFANNAATTLASGITNAATSLTVASGAGALFPTLTGSQYFYCTLETAAGTLREIVKVTARSTDTFTITRAQDGTTAQAFSTGDKVELRLVRANLTDFALLDEVNTFSQTQTLSAAPILSSITGLVKGNGASAVTAATAGTDYVAPGGALGTPSSGTLTNCTGYTYANLTGTVPTWNQNTTGTASNITGTYTGSISSSQVTTALGYTPYNAGSNTVLTNANYTSYSPSLTGSGASGTWSISITGSAASITGTYSGSLTSSQVTTALGYTPYNASNPSGYLSSAVTSATAGTGMSVSGSTGSVTFNATGTTINSQTAAYTLVAADAGKTISTTAGGVTIPNSVMSAGNIVTIYNNSGSSQTITQGSGVTLQWAGQSSSTTGNRTLGLYGIATIVFISASVAVISGAGLS